MFPEKVMKRMSMETGANGKQQLKKSPYPRRHTSPNVQIADEIKATIQDREIITDKDNARRRTIIVRPRLGSYGFDLESYRIYHKETSKTEIVSFVSYVEEDGPAYKAGMRPGDTIASVNGTSVMNLEHEQIVTEIRSSSGCDLRLIVVFEDYVHKIKLHKKLIQLKRKLHEKESELKNLEMQEQDILQRRTRPVSLTSEPSYSDMSAIFDMGRTSLTTGWDLRVPGEQRVSPLSMRKAVVSTSSLPLPSPTKEFDIQNYKLDRRTFAGTSASTDHDADDGIVFSALVGRGNDTCDTVDRGLRSPDSGYDEVSLQRNSRAISDDGDELSSHQRYSKLSSEGDDELPLRQGKGGVVNDDVKENEQRLSEHRDNSEHVADNRDVVGKTFFTFPQPSEAAHYDDSNLPINEEDEDTSFGADDDTAQLLEEFSKTSLPLNDDEEDTVM
ncbi:cytohesin-interacting protein-like [Ptychodera flava]|uniref:cytohesin-interacting protein-like n=1 Tax=Ptychodera flava TaxID=63121 RepID=UPI00396A8B21